MGEDITKQRHDLDQTQEDFQWVMEDYFGLNPHDLNAFEMDKTIGWEYNDIDNYVTFYFDNEWNIDEFMDALKDSPATNGIYHFEEWSCVDREKLTLRVEGKMGGLI